MSHKTWCFNEQYDYPSITTILIENYLNTSKFDSAENHLTDFYGESFLEEKLNEQENVNYTQQSNSLRRNIILIKNRNKKKVIINLEERIKLLKKTLKKYYKEIQVNYLKMKRKEVYKNKTILSKEEEKFIKNIIYRYLYIKCVIIKIRIFLKNFMFISY